MNQTIAKLETSVKELERLAKHLPDLIYKESLLSTIKDLKAAIDELKAR